MSSTSSGGIGGLPTQLAVDTNCRCCGQNVTPPPSEVLPIINSVIAPGDDGRIAIFGSNFINNDFGPIDRIDVELDNATVHTFYSTTGPNAGLNPAGTSEFTLPNLPDTDSGLTLTNNNLLGGQNIVSVTVYDTGGNYTVPFAVAPPLAVPGTPLTYPLLEGICSPAPETIRFTGQRFLTATAGAVGYVIPRGDAPILGGPAAIYELADGSPDANGWSLISHTDNEIELHNAALGAGDTVWGVAFHNADTLGYYYLEPWGDPSHWRTSHPARIRMRAGAGGLRGRALRYRLVLAGRRATGAPAGSGGV